MYDLFPSRLHQKSALSFYVEMIKESWKADCQKRGIMFSLSRSLMLELLVLNWFNAMVKLHRLWLKRKNNPMVLWIILRFLVPITSSNIMCSKELKIRLVCVCSYIHVCIFVSVSSEAYGGGFPPAKNADDGVSVKPDWRHFHASS